jgi:hypothetical protein
MHSYRLSATTSSMINLWYHSYWFPLQLCLDSCHRAGRGLSEVSSRPLDPCECRWWVVFNSCRGSSVHNQWARSSLCCCALVVLIAPWWIIPPLEVHWAKGEYDMSKFEKIQILYMDTYDILYISIRLHKIKTTYFRLHRFYKMCDSKKEIYQYLSLCVHHRCYYFLWKLCHTY